MVGLPLIGKEGSETPVFKILVRALGMVMVFYDVIIMWLSCDPEIILFTYEVWFIELAEVFQMKIMCIDVYISAPPKNLKSNSHFSLFVACSVKNKTMAVCTP